ncbi:tRNA (adenosine(37)-N6)-dimethylallyltransferase MiaA [Jannaschia sp. S6380]|uniref:tRNA (adenosine(37)-N6)-dimethylallyltransferase MiaA n=1 Tax=Jannaschia sp. S6380 TaxID=2926408 RepID=UPI001FF2F798|nr:tRNA (adenosine(37)-N6)-dimethylallyltransferase MiaA [Jannaschia sp. S6380]MCK0166535.1 tRNA (adenosine(37)-N6)-dimethylallyltransferase MiaA [Jannaschia sp. S6380]
MLELIGKIDRERPILIAGPTASGKSSLALAIARAKGGRIVNADALQVFADWRILTARPSPEEESAAPHALYGHVGWSERYTTGDWLRQIAPFLQGLRPIIVGGTGLYFRALTEGLADIPPIPPEIRTAAAARLERVGLDAMGRDLSEDVRTDIDLANPMRVLRAWEVARATGRSIRDWQADTPSPLLDPAKATTLVLDAPRDWLTPRLERRFDAMIAQGALDEVRAVLPKWDPAANAAQAIGAAELVAHLRGEIDLAAARDRAVIATRRYAKRQRTWFQARMKAWQRVDATNL